MFWKFIRSFRGFACSFAILMVTVCFSYVVIYLWIPWGSIVNDLKNKERICGPIVMTYGNEKQGLKTIGGEITQTGNGILRVYLDEKDISEAFSSEELEQRFGGLCAGKCIGNECPSNFVEADAILG